jgi:hypothetical protein
LDFILDVELPENFITETQPDTRLKLKRHFPSNTIESVDNEFSKLREKEVSCIFRTKLTPLKVINLNDIPANLIVQIESVILNSKKDNQPE